MVSIGFPEEISSHSLGFLVKINQPVPEMPIAKRSCVNFEVQKISKRSFRFCS
jgi:hypothetical protein